MKVLTALDAQRILRQELPHARFRLADADFNLPTKRWLLGPCSRWFRSVLTALRVFTWTPTHDCDDKARGFAWLAGILHQRSRKRHKAQALAVFEIWYQPDTGQPHAINAAICDDNQVVFVEPQGPHQITLSRKERDSCYFVR